MNFDESWETQFRAQFRRQLFPDGIVLHVGTKSERVKALRNKSWECVTKRSKEKVPDQRFNDSGILLYADPYRLSELQRHVFLRRDVDEVFVSKERAVPIVFLAKTLQFILRVGDPLNVKLPKRNLYFEEVGNHDDRRLLAGLLCQRFEESICRLAIELDVDLCPQLIGQVVELTPGRDWHEQDARLLSRFMGSDMCLAFSIRV